MSCKKRCVWLLGGLEQEGQALVEMALVLPVLLLVVTGILTFGLAFNNYILLTEATSVGARTLAISRGETTNPCATAAAAVYAAAPLLVPGNLTFTFVLNGTTYKGASCNSGSNTTGAAGNLKQGAYASVTVSYPCSLAVYGTDYAPNCSLQIADLRIGSMRTPSNARSWLGGECGQVLPLVAVAFVVLLGMAGLAIDVGHVYYCERALQGYADAAALAGAGDMRTATTSAAVIATSTSFSAVPGSVNAQGTLPNVTMASGFPVLKCLTTLQNQGLACVGAVPYNALQVQVQVVVPMYFAALFGINTMTVTAGATAASRGGAATPYNVAVVVDTSLSMLYPDADCGSTEIACAMNGVQVLLKTLTPCAASLAKCSITNGVAASAVDRVALFTFPDVSTTTTARDVTCTTPVPSPTPQNLYWSMANGGATINFVMPMSNTGTTPVTPWSSLPAAMAYSFPAVGASSYVPTQSDFATYPMTLGTATYQVTQFLSDYRTSNAATTLNSNSTLVKAAGGVIGCGSMTSPNYDGIFGTYYAGVIYAAQSALVAEKALNPGTENVLIFLSDGDATAPQNNGNNTVMGSPATSSGQYPSWVGECGQAVVAAKYATSQGTLVYSVAYGSEPSGCASDQSGGSYPNISPCDTMASIASAAQYFYSDYHQSGSGSVCVAGQPVTSLSAIFSAISADLTTARLIPNNTT